MRLRTLGLLAVIAMVVVSCGGGEPEAAGPSEGIQVHGDWTIDIYNEDGSLDEHHEFSNALTPSGSQVLAELLTPIWRVGSWRVVVGEQGDPSRPDNSPCGSAGNQEPCEVVPEIVVPGDGTLVLEGDFAAEIDGRIDLVTTRVGRCVPDDPTGCVFVDFTQTTVLDENGIQLRVDADQQVQVEVEISFTSG